MFDIIGGIIRRHAAGTNEINVLDLIEHRRLEQSMTHYEATQLPNGHKVVGGVLGNRSGLFVERPDGTRYVIRK